MSIKEANRLSVMRQIDKKILTLQKASEELGVSIRQIKRIRKRYLTEGEKGLISRHIGKVSTNRIDSEKKARILSILHFKKYLGFGPTLMAEKLKELHNYSLSDETVRKWMIEEKLWEAKIKRV